MSNIKKIFLSAFLAVGLIGLAPSTAEAGSPQEIDCAVLENALVIIDGSGSFEFNNLGDLISTAVTDEAVFDSLRNAIFALSGGTILFSEPSDALKGIARCKLMPLLGKLTKD